MHGNSEVMAKVPMTSWCEAHSEVMWVSRDLMVRLTSQDSVTSQGETHSEVMWVSRDLMVRLTSQVSVTSQGETHSEVNVSMIFVVIRGSFLLDLAYWKTVVYICLYINPNFDK